MQGNEEIGESQIETKFNGGKTINGINTWAVFFLSYSAAFID